MCRAPGQLTHAGKALLQSRSDMVYKTNVRIQGTTPHGEGEATVIELRSNVEYGGDLSWQTHCYIASSLVPLYANLCSLRTTALVGKLSNVPSCRTIQPVNGKIWRRFVGLHRPEGLINLTGLSYWPLRLTMGPIVRCFVGTARYDVH
jgi:hypothetical protein